MERRSFIGALVAALPFASALGSVRGKAPELPEIDMSDYIHLLKPNEVPFDRTWFPSHCLRLRRHSLDPDQGGWSWNRED